MFTPEVIYIIAQVLSYTGNLLFTSSSLFKRKRTIILLQSTNHFLSGVAQFLTAAYSGMVQDCVSLIRNIILLFIKDSQKLVKLILSIVCTIVAVTVGIVFNILFSGNVWYGYLPCIATFLYSSIVTLVYVVSFTANKTEVILKSGLIVNSLLWGTYGVFVGLYAITIFNSITLIVSVISIIRVAISCKRKKNSDYSLSEPFELL